MARDSRVLFHAKSLLIRAIHGNDATAITCKARGPPRNHAPLAITQAAFEATNVSTLAVGRHNAAMFELMRGDRTRAAPNAFELSRLARERELPMWRSFGVFLEGWTTSTSGAIGAGLEDMRCGVEQLREQNVLLFDGLLKIALAEAEAAAGDLDRALAVLDEGLATADRVGYRAFEAELHRVGGEMLLRRDHMN